MVIGIRTKSGNSLGTEYGDKQGELTHLAMIQLLRSGCFIGRSEACLLSLLLRDG